jgi:argininosuccinate lyase
MAAAAGAGFSTATDLADWLVRELTCRSATPTTSPARR